MRESEREGRRSKRNRIKGGRNVEESQERDGRREGGKEGRTETI